VFRDARSIRPGSVVDCDLCVVGAGAAGITLARELRATGLRLCVLESGGMQPDPSSQSLYAGRVSGQLLEPGSEYLSATRLRYFGGSTNHWEGFCRPLDPIDFEERPWIPHSGWPFDHGHLEPWYRRAAQVLEIAPFGYGLGQLRPARGRPLALPAETELETRVVHFSPPTRFGARYRSELREAENVHVLLHANAVELRSDAEASRVEHVEVATLPGTRFRVRARGYVLAAGGIENARLLLCSNSVQASGLANHNDRVGRFFMDHLFQEYDPGVVVMTAPARDMAFYSAPHRDRFLGHASLGLLVFSADAQRRHRLPNHGIAGFRPLAPGSEPPLGREVASAAADLARLAPGGPGRGVHPFRAHLGITSEPLPHPDNRVTLADDTDALGVRRARLHWSLGSEEKESLVRTVEVFARALGSSLQGRARVQLSSRYRWSRMRTSSHHVGTTRMHRDPRRGVVDPDGRTHGVANLYVAGSSVFPTAGQANPTLTLVALTLRLAEHLKRVLR
jgi:choline dehydrogenase-like flavoprotein